MTRIKEFLTEKYTKGLDLFGGTGKLVTKEVSQEIENYEIWDNNPENEDKIRQNCPNAVIKICNSYEEILKTRKRFDFILCDNPIATPEKLEHFIIFQHIMRICKKRATIILDVIPEKNELSQKRCETSFNERHCTNRMKFYTTSQPEKISILHMVDIYTEIIESKGFKLESWDSTPRVKGAYVHFLKLVIVK